MLAAVQCEGPVLSVEPIMRISPSSQYIFGSPGPNCHTNVQLRIEESSGIIVQGALEYKWAYRALTNESTENNSSGLRVTAPRKHHGSGLNETGTSKIPRSATARVGLTENKNPPIHDYLRAAFLRFCSRLKFFRRGVFRRGLRAATGKISEQNKHWYHHAAK
jgi:hypothetical protein